MGTKYRVVKRGRLWEVDALYVGTTEWETAVMQSGFWQMCMYFVTGDRRHAMAGYVLKHKLVWVSQQPAWSAR